MKRLLKWSLVIGGASVLILAAAIAVLRSDWLSEQLRARIVTEVERATGGRTEIGAFRFEWTTLTVRVDRLVLHGREEAGHAPFLSIKSLTLGLAVDSWLRRDVKLRSLTAEEPQVHIYVAADGQTNIPRPALPPSQTTVIEDLIRVRIGTLALEKGTFEFASRAAPFSTHAEGIDLKLTFDHASPRYGVNLSSRRVELPEGYAPSVEAQGRLESTRFILDDLHLSQNRIDARLQGELRDFRAPSLSGKFKLSAPLADIPQSPLREGAARAEGTFKVEPGGAWMLAGSVAGDGLAWRSGETALQGIRLSSSFRLDAARLGLDSLRLASPLGEWEGSASIENWRRYQLEGELTSLALDELQRISLKKPYPWHGTAAGPLRLSGVLAPGGPRQTLVETQLTITPAAGQLPLEGLLDLRFDQEAGEIEFGSSHLQLGSSRLNFSGTLGKRLEAGFFSTRISELEPVLAMILEQDSFEIPVGLRNGEARLEAAIAGDLKNPRAEGKLALSNAIYEDLTFERLDAAFRIDKDSVEFPQLRVRFEKARLEGRIQFGLTGWQPDSRAKLGGELTLTGVDLERAARLFGTKPVAAGVASGTVILAGTPATPSLEIKTRVDDLRAGGEQFKTVEAQLGLDGPSGKFQGVADLENGRLRADGSWLHPPADFMNGSLDVRLTASGFRLNSIEMLTALRPGLNGALEGNLAVRTSIEKGTLLLRGLEGTLRSPVISVGSRRLGEFSFEAATTGRKLDAKMRLELPDAPVEGQATVELDGDYPAEGSLRVPRVSFGLFHDLVSPGPEPDKAAEWPVRGTLAGGISWRAPLAQPGKATARLTVTDLQVFPRTEILPELQIKPDARTLRNSGPLIFDLDSAAARIGSARLTALDTNITAIGSLSWKVAGAWNVDVAGAINLSVLSTFQPNLVASGTARISAGLRGSAADPQLGGRMEIVDGSFFLKDVPNGIEKANGLILFEKGRANIEKLAGQTGGGEFSISGFVGLNKDQLLYRLQADGKNIRVRYPEGVSTTADASITLAGSPLQSQLSGTVTVRRAGFQGQGDLGNVVSGSGNPIPAAAARNEFLRNLQFDIRIRTAADAVVHSSYTEDLETEADLRLRGSPSNPILLGSIKVNQGGVQFFGNRYTVSRGEMTFFNTAVVQPVIDLDLETRVRGIMVFINLSGPLTRLNVNYRSEPPLQSNEILALLAVGRTPVSASSSIPASPVIRSQTVLENSPNTLLGAALSASVSGRMERFFGATRMKIDPQVTGVENVNSARLSIEQSISRDITLTYIMNLSRTQQQIVRIEWDLSRRWQMIAVRDENGVFAVDFVFRKRFK